MMKSEIFRVAIGTVQTAMAETTGVVRPLVTGVTADPKRLALMAGRTMYLLSDAEYFRLRDAAAMGREADEQLKAMRGVLQDAEAMLRYIRSGTTNSAIRAPDAPTAVQTSGAV